MFCCSIRLHQLVSKRRLGIGAVLAIFLSSAAFAGPPLSIAKSYGKKDTGISDEFTAGNKKKLPSATRWSARPNPSVNTKNVRGGIDWAFAKNNVLHCIGDFKKKNAGGIVSKKTRKYGFYETRWRGEGFKFDKQSPFHPSIWMAETDAKGGQVKRGPGGDWLEIDFIEYEVGKLGWSSDAPPFVNGKKRKAKGDRAIMVARNTQGVLNTWNHHGLEYTPGFLQVWVRKNGKWSKIGRKVVFGDDSNKFNGSTVPKSARTAGYWYIGNLWLTEFPTFVDANQKQNTKFMVDFFRFYPRK